MVLGDIISYSTKFSLYKYYYSIILELWLNSSMINFQFCCKQKYHIIYKLYN
jgi:hypothetical protein